MSNPTDPITAQGSANLPDEVRTARSTFAEREMRPDHTDEHGRERREPIHDSFRSKFYIDPEKIPEGKIYRWAREKTYSESPTIDENNLMEYLEEGWEFVPASHHPDLCLDAVLHGRKVKETDRIKKFGHVLMSMDLSRWRRLQQAQKQASYDQMMSVKHSMPGAENPADFQMFFTKGNDLSYTHAVVRDKGFQE